MPGTVSVSDAVELAVVERSGFVESRHAGIAVVLDPDGVVAAEHGNTAALVLPRSALKPLQALACVSAGAWLEGERLAVATGSHSGTDRHVAVVRDILDSARLTEQHLACPPAWPSDVASRDALVREHGEPARLRMACSGKHAAMLLACTVNGWDVEGYLAPDHPLQVHIRELVERLTGDRVAVTAVDGCGAPAPAVSLGGLARAAHRIGTSSERSPFALHRNAAALVDAVRQNAWAIAGPGRPDTVVVERLGVFSKQGAEGVALMVAPNGATVALKMLDGSSRATAVVALRLLERAGALAAGDVAETLTHLRLSVTGGDGSVGSVRAVV
ncbi:asparaginase [Microbacterium sp. X-17]|uniref:asparaginase n=1 Tax=Microbacterium sp. X-17 TaxID=3144404 RepID=UPI0031F5A7AD